MKYGKSLDITNIINYLRRSRQDAERERRTGEDTLASQKKLMTNVLNGYGVPYIQKEEIGSGDKIATRPVFVQIIEELKEGKYDAIAVKEISRLGRGSYSDMGIIYDLLKDKRLYIITPYKIYDCANESDLKQIRFELFMSREEFETTRERLTGARYNAAMEGKWMGNIPFGYMRNERTMFLEPIEEEAKVVRLIYDLYLNGYEGKVVREKAIATILERHGIKTAKNCKYWDTTQLKRILTNEAYIGVSKFRTTKRNSEGKVEARPEEEHIIVEDAHPPIISSENFFKIQAIMKDSLRPKTKLDVNNYELTGLFTCKTCNCKAVINRYKRKRASGEYYDTYLKCRNGCFAVKYDFAETALVNLLKYLKDADKNIVYALYQRTAAKKDDKKEQQNQLQEQMKEGLEKRKKIAEDRLEFIFEKHAEGIYSDTMFQKFEAKILTELEEIAALEENTIGVQETAASVVNELNYGKITNDFIKIIDVYNSNVTAEDKNELLRKIICSLHIKIVEKGTKKQIPNISLEVNLKHDFWEGNF